MDIIVKNLCKTYDRNRVLDHFSCTFREKKMTCIMGKSGIGKSTLLSILMGLEKADEGTVSGMEHQKISAIFQENRLFENLDAVTNIHITTGKTKEEITGFLKKMELDDIAGKPVSEYSGGMKRNSRNTVYLTKTEERSRRLSLKLQIILIMTCQKINSASHILQNA